jgi:hypothetical protein
MICNDGCYPSLVYISPPGKKTIARRAHEHAITLGVRNNAIYPIEISLLYFALEGLGKSARGKAPGKHIRFFWPGGSV